MSGAGSNKTSLEKYVEATREMQHGFATCRVCGRRKPIKNYLTVQYDNGMVFAVCIKCIDDGHEINVRRGPRGIEVYARKQGIIEVAGSSPVGGTNG